MNLNTFKWHNAYIKNRPKFKRLNCEKGKRKRQNNLVLIVNDNKAGFIHMSVFAVNYCIFHNFYAFFNGRTCQCRCLYNVVDASHLWIGLSIPFISFLSLYWMESVDYRYKHGHQMMFNSFSLKILCTIFSEFSTVCVSARDDCFIFPQQWRCKCVRLWVWVWVYYDPY